MKQEQKTQLAGQVAEIICGLEVRDAIDVIGQAQSIAAKSNPQYSLISIYVIADMVAAMNGEKATIALTKDGSVSFDIKAKKESKKGLKI